MSVTAKRRWRHSMADKRRGDAERSEQPSSDCCDCAFVFVLLKADAGPATPSISLCLAAADDDDSWFHHSSSALEMPDVLPRYTVLAKRVSNRV
jgi:hypothetical protein